MVGDGATDGDTILHSHRRENLKSYTTFFMLPLILIVKTHVASVAGYS
jgi:hypothetical protein